MGGKRKQKDRKAIQRRKSVSNHQMKGKLNTNENESSDEEAEDPLNRTLNFPITPARTPCKRRALAFIRSRFIVSPHCLAINAH